MKELPKISEAEWEVMKTIWEHSPCTSNQIIERLEDTSKWMPKTIKTLINRLVKKDVLAFNVEGRVYYYYPLLTKQECVKAESKSFLKRIYNGTLKSMLINFIEENELTKEEICELKEMLDERKP
jgi:BlaI family penicillinase repressor